MPINLQNISRKVRNRLFACETLFLYRFEKQYYPTSPASIVPATMTNINDVLQFDKPDHLLLFQQFLQRGDRGYLAYLENICLHHSWVICKPGVVFLHWSVPMTLLESEVYIHFCETGPTGRGKNIFPHVLSVIASDFYGSKNMYICVNSNNAASIRSIEKAGFCLWKKIWTIALLNIRLIKRESVICK